MSPVAGPPKANQGQRLKQLLAQATMRSAAWLIEHSGPLQPLVRQVGANLYLARVRRLSTQIANPLNLDGFSIYHDGGLVMGYMMATGTFEPHVTRLFGQLLKPGMSVVDVGANMGYYSLLSAKYVGTDGTVWAFEPAPPALHLLRQSVSYNNFDQTVYIMPEAVGQEDGTVDLYVNTSEGLFSSLFEEASQHQELSNTTIRSAIERVTVTCTSLDSWAHAHNWPRVDLVKIDIEGGETAVLRGMVEMSKRNPQQKSIIEYNLRTMRSAGVTPREFVAALADCGFTTVTVIGERPIKLAMPCDLALMAREVRRRGSEYVNILCEKD